MTDQPPVSGSAAKESQGFLPGSSAGTESGNTGAQRTGRASVLVAAGILSSRMFGLVRERVFAHYFGNTMVADAFRTAFKIPNLLQNLFGEGVLSASFIPVYAGLLGKNEEEQASRVADTIFTMLILAQSIIVITGIFCAPWLTTFIAPGFEGEKRLLTIQLVRIIFPGAALFGLSAWTLGILNSHRKFLLSYAAPVLWNAMILLALITGGQRMDLPVLAAWTAWGSLAGSLCQFLIQLPTVIRLKRSLRFSRDWNNPYCRTILKNFVPAFVGRGIIQISGYLDTVLASFLSNGAQAGLSYAQILYTLPVSLFGMSVSAAELPEMSRLESMPEGRSRELKNRLDTSLRRIAFFVVPSAVAFLALGDLVAGVVYQTGRFTRDDALYVWAILAGYGIGLMASTASRLYANMFYALKDPRTPLRIAVVRIICSIGIGSFLAFWVVPRLGIPDRWGVAGLAAGTGVTAWLELTWLRRKARRRLGLPAGTFSDTAHLLLPALAGAAAARTLCWLLPPGPPLLTGLPALGLYGTIYLFGTWLRRVPESIQLLEKGVKMAGRFRKGP